MLNYEEFTSYVECNIKDVLPDEFFNATVTLSDIQKNNGLELKALIIKTESKNITPTIYLDSCYKDYRDGMELDSVLNSLAETFQKLYEQTPDLHHITDGFRDFGKVKEKLFVAVVNTDKNQSFLQGVPHKEIEDLSLIYKVRVDGVSSDNIGTITVKNEHLLEWGVSKEELHEAAMENSKVIAPAVIKTLNDVVKEMMLADGMPEEVVETMIPEIPTENMMYVITNEQKISGASAMFYSDALEKVAATVENDLYVLPSSIHECIAVSVDTGTKEDLAAMVREVNGNVVDVVEQLSDNVYKYDKDAKTLTLASEQKERELIQEPESPTMQNNVRRKSR